MSAQLILTSLKSEHPKKVDEGKKDQKEGKKSNIYNGHGLRDVRLLAARDLGAGAKGSQKTPRLGRPDLAPMAQPPSVTLAAAAAASEALAKEKTEMLFQRRRELPPLAVGGGAGVPTGPGSVRPAPGAPMLRAREIVIDDNDEELNDFDLSAPSSIQEAAGSAPAAPAAPDSGEVVVVGASVADILFTKKEKPKAAAAPASSEQIVVEEV